MMNYWTIYYIAIQYKQVYQYYGGDTRTMHVISDAVP